ncbi:MAG: SMC family ATPase [Acidimicrobiales bacterium]|nr:SMC family ATPase [Acidimicrobiales bacterium]
MRPERLELEGFTAFRNRTVVEFTDADLFAFSGPTGAGKSSLIDAIVFVLYGTIPRLADRRRVGPVISQGKVEARLGLTFGVGPAQYRAVRVVRATPSGGASTKEARLERLVDGEPAELLAGDADEVTRQVERLLGLTYEHFTTAVVLPQGEFARFLHHKPADRQALLKELLDLGLYDRLQQRAHRHAVIAAEAARFARSRLEELAGADDEQLAELTTARRTVAALLARCDAAQPELDELTHAFETSAAQAKTRRQGAEQLRAVRPPDGLAALAAAHDDAAARTAELEQQTEGYDRACEQADAALAALPPEATSRAALDRHATQAKQATLVTRGERALAGARTAQAAATEAAEAAEARRRAADEALVAARTAHAAAALAEHLHAGDDCPVCGRRIDALPVLAGDAELALRGAGAEAADAAATADAALTARRAAELEVARIEAQLDLERGRLEELALEVAAGPDEATAQRDLDAARQAAAAVQAARTARTAHGKALDAVRLALRRSDERRQQAWVAFDAARDRIAALGPPAAARRDPAEDWAALAHWAAGAELEVLRGLAAAEEERDRIAEARRARTAELLDAAMTVLPDAHTLRTVAEIRDRCIATDGRLAAELARLEADRERAAAVQRDLDRAVEDEQVATMLTQLLRANRFGAWILDEAVQQLVQGATGLLQRLSGGAYSLVLEGKDFAVIDHNNADAVRSARTLSGGETFLASLALALALADQVVMLAGPTAAPLESLFLDEGFGTLDPDTLDTVASAIEELGSAGRMVGIVTHVRDLAERLPVRFEVTKDVDGARVERVLA